MCMIFLPLYFSALMVLETKLARYVSCSSASSLLFTILLGSAKLYAVSIPSHQRTKKNSINHNVNSVALPSFYCALCFAQGGRVPLFFPFSPLCSISSHPIRKIRGILRCVNLQTCWLLLNIARGTINRGV